MHWKWSFSGVFPLVFSWLLPAGDAPPTHSAMPQIQPLTVIAAQDARFLVEDVFVGSNCFDIRNPVLSGFPGQSGLFFQGGATLGIEHGIILSTGNVNDAKGPNTLPNTSTNYSLLNNDPDLVALSGGVGIYDPVYIEFDFTPATNHVSFSYVFASEEYCEFATVGFNDIFGFFLSGPGISGPFSNNAINLAIVPGTDMPVGVFSINHYTNTGFYRNNIPLGMSGCSSTPGLYTQYIEYDGLTTVLNATASVVPCETYHIKIILADKSEGNYDSAVFLGAQSFQAGAPVRVSAGISGSGPDSITVYEGCGDAYFRFERTDSNWSAPLTIPVTLSPSSSATPGADFAPLPGMVAIPAGQGTFVLPVTVFRDALEEGVETIGIEIPNSCDCRPVYAELRIIDPPPLSVSIPDTTTCDGRSVIILPAVSGGIPGYTYLWDTGDTTLSLNVQPTASTHYNLTVTDRCGQAISRAVRVEVSRIALTVSANPPSCHGLSDGFISASADGGSAPYYYTWSSGSPGIFALAGLPAGIYNVTVQDAEGCRGETGVELSDPPPITAQLLVEQPPCHEDMGLLFIRHTGGGIPPLQYSIDGGSTFQAGPEFENLAPGVHSIAVLDANYCMFRQEALVVAPPPLYINLAPYASAALGENIRIAASVNVPPQEIASLHWIPSEGLSCNDCLSPTLTALRSGTYTLRVETLNGCSATDSVAIGVDRTPAVFIPNAFTPHNGDGINDRFSIFARTGAIRRITALRIFDRWGEMVFAQFDFPPNDETYGWDGSHKSKPLPQDVFAWWAEIEWIDGSTGILKGDVTLLR